MTRSTLLFLLVSGLLLGPGCKDNDDFGNDDDTGDDDTADDDTGDDDTSTDDDTAEVDADGDGYTADEDCDDNDENVHPGATEVACDGIDNDCDEQQHPDDVDDDGDGYTECDGDCDDADETVESADADGDGFSTCEDDCDDTLDSVYPHATEVPLDQVDQNCDGLDYCVDLSCDNWTDIVYANNNNGNTGAIDSYIYLGSDSGYSAADRDTVPTMWAQGSEIADLDGDGYLDIVFANHDQAGDPFVNSYVYWGGATGYSPQNRTDLPTSGGSDVAVGHLNGDSYLDIVFANHNNELYYDVDSFIYWGSNTGYSDQNRTGLPTLGASGVAVADLDTDGFTDIVFANHRIAPDDMAVDSYVYWGSNAGFSTQNRTSLPTTGAIRPGIVDLDADTHLDIVFSNFSADEINYLIDSTIFWGNGSDFSTQNRTDLPTQGGFDNAAADLDDDGDLDLVFSNQFNGTFNVDSFIYWGEPGGYTVKSRTELADSRAAGFEIADLDGDGWQDLVFTDVYDGATFQLDSPIYWGSANGFSAKDVTGLPTMGGTDVSVAGPGIPVLMP